MRPELEQNYLIDKFLKGELSDNELSDFNIQLIENHTFAHDVSAQKIANELVIENKLLEVRKLLKKHEPKNYTSWFRNTILMVISGSFAVSVLVWGYLNLQNKNDLELINQTVFSEKDSDKTTTVAEDLDKGSKNVKKQSNSPKAQSSKEITSNNVYKESLEKGDTEPLQMEPAIEISSRQIVKIKQLEINKDIPCDKINYEMNVSTTPTCENETNGKVKIDVINTEGKVNSYSLDGEKYYKTSFFDNLSAGIYHIYLKDKDGCVFEDKGLHEIKTKKCAQENDFIFHPSVQGSWSFPSQGKQNFTITILDKSGTVFFKTKSILGVPNSWDGVGNNGVPALPGLYFYIIEEENGSTEKGYITIIM